jgi:predicted alpha/beta hydrolase family esterase
MVAHWAAVASAASRARIRGALLVAPSDPFGPAYPVGPTGFGPVPLQPLPFRSIVVASDDDPYVTLTRATEYAMAWGSDLVTLCGAGHINVAAGFGPWPEGYALLQSLRPGAVPSARVSAG